MDADSGNNWMEFRIALQRLSEQLDRSNIKAMKFLLGDKISGFKLESADSGCDLFQLLMDLDLMSIPLLKEVMLLIGRNDLKVQITQLSCMVSDFPQCPLQQKGELDVLRTLLYRIAEQMNPEMVNDVKFIEGLTKRDDIIDGIDIMNYFIREKPICSTEEIPKKLECHRNLVNLYYKLNHSGRSCVTVDGADTSGQYTSRMSSLFPLPESPTFPNEYFQLEELTVGQCYDRVSLPDGAATEFYTGIFKGKPVIIKSMINSTAAQKKDLQTTVYLRHPFLLSLIRAEGLLVPTLRSVNLVYSSEFKTNTSLKDFLQRHRTNSDLDEQKKRVKILYQISDALCFLHTRVKDIRGPIVHMDVKPHNIFLDQYDNALLGNVDVAVEVHDNATHRSVDRYEVDGYSDQYKENKRQKKPSDDIFSLGIVILQALKWKQLEVLPKGQTLFDCVDQLVTSQLGKSIEKATKEEIEKVVLTDDFIDKNIWKNEWRFSKEGNEVGLVALKCLLHPDNRINAAQCVTAFKDMLVKNYCKLWEHHEYDERCIQCHFYDTSKVLKITSDSCTKGCAFYNRFCRECHYFSFRNPLHCPMHEMVYPMIGSPRNFAILMTGCDSMRQQAQAFQKDVDYVKRVITDPRIMNIRSDNLLLVRKGKIETASHLKEEVKKRIQGQVDFLFVYYSGHCTKTGSIRVSNNHCDDDDGDAVADVINIKKLREILGGIKFKRLLILFDCCFAARLDLTPDQVPECYEWMMILYSSDVQNAARCNTKWGSIFTQYFVAGLQSTKVCLCEKWTDNNKKRNERGVCPALQKFRTKAAKTGFIELRNLIEYMVDPEHGSAEQQPVQDFRERKRCADLSENNVIAYYNSSPIAYNFRFIDIQNKSEVPLQLEQIDYSATSLEDAVICRLHKEIRNYTPSVDIPSPSDLRLETEAGREITTVEEFKRLALGNECFKVYHKEDLKMQK